MSGPLLGAIYVIVLAASFAVALVCDDTTRLMHGDQLFGGLAALLVWSLPCTLVLGASAGSSAPRIAKAPPVLRGCIYVLIAMVTMTVATPVWLVFVPWAIAPTMLYALAFERWLVRPHLEPRPRSPRSRTLLSTNPHVAALEKGALVGASTALIVALVHASAGDTGRACGLFPCPWFVEARPPSPADIFAVIAMHGVPAGILWGVLVGEVAHRSQGVRAPAVFGVALLGMFVFAIGWSELLEKGIGVTLVHAAVLLSWTRHERPVVMPEAILRTSDRRRSTCCRGARSRGPRPKPSGTSRTTR